MKILMLILILATTLKYFYLLNEANYVLDWLDVLNHVYHVGMILGLCFIARNIF